MTTEPTGRPRVGEDPAWTTWRQATQRALYGADGFYRRAGGPAAHFRTSVHASPAYAGALLRLAHDCGLTTVVDVGSGRGELLLELHRRDPALRLVAVEVADRPPDLPDALEWGPSVPDGLTDALVVANEWLDNVPVEVVQQAADGPRVLEVEVSTGAERLGQPPSGADAAWLDRWWPLGAVGERAEVGRYRDEAWAAVLRRVRRGLAVAIDYGHRREDRPPHGTLTGFAAGRAVPPIPDGSCDITCHVAIDACAAAGAAAGADWTGVTSQRSALHALGVDAALPLRTLAQEDPAAYVVALARAGEAGELLARGGLGGFDWLVQGFGVPVPARLSALVGPARRVR